MRLELNTSWIALAIGSALAFAPTAFAQTAQNERDTLVVTGTAVPVNADKVGQTITVISEQLIEDQGYVYVPDVLRQVPSVAVSQPGAPGSLTQVRIRGGEANHTLVLLDGIDISSPDQGETDFSTLLTGGIGRIEVLRGPQSGLYGSNALAGVVNLISRREVDGHSFGASVEAGSFDTVELAANAGLGDADTYAAISANRLTSSGYDVSPDQTANGVSAVGSAKPGDKEGNTAASLNLRGGAAVSETLHIHGVARYFKSTAELDGQAFGFPIAGRTYDDASETEHEQTMVGGSAVFDPFAGVWETTLSASYVDESRINRTTNFPFLFGPPAPTQAELLAIPLVQSAVDSTRAKLGLLSTLRFGDANIAQFLSGFVETERETFKTPAPASRDESRTLNAFGLQYRAEIAEQLNLYATVRRDQNDDFEDADTYSLAASWAIPNTGSRLHTSYGTGVTNPTFIEQFGFDPGTFIGNAALVPEEAVGWDFGIEQTLIADKLVVDLTYFKSTLDNEIFTDFLPTFETTPLNSRTDSDRSGWELYVTANPLEDVSLVASWTELDASEPNGIEVRRPEQQGSLDASWRIGGGDVQLNLGVTYNGDMLDTDFATFLRTRVDPYTLVRFGASWQVSDQVEIYGRVENLLDETYQDVIGYIAAPQAAYVGIRFRDEASK